MTDEVKAAAEGGKDESEAKSAEPTAQFRWFHPAGQIATGRTLQQLWTDESWRDVPVFQEEAE